MIGLPNTTVVQKHKTHAPAADTEAIATVAAVADNANGQPTIHVLRWIHFSYDKAPGGIETLIVEIDSSTVWQIDIPNAVIVRFIPFGKGLYSVTGNEELKVTLSAATGTCKGKVNIGYE